ncbi:UvrD-helicase domain-containing protein [Marinifilum flexuosum]|uniref:UvrD-helicase domain-containing protein n=1 Tax=Marinifilum flexuosum TaxID=1117708 RepID=UPI002490FF7D|nr:UvrD-helicase domain-containing protein [Marinifilum flexuosum]
MNQNPAEIAAEKALSELFGAIDRNQNFRLEAGAGAGKTYSLIKALKYVIENKSRDFQKKNQQIACITYTNVAKDEINSRTDNNEIVLAETIHGFCWGVLKGLQKQMREYIPQISNRWNKRIEEVGGLSNQTVIYDLGYPKATEKEINLHHDDVIKIFTHFLSKDKFVHLIKSKYPVLFIDEYQDTNKDLAEALIKYIIVPKQNMLIGLFGDHWQKIYGNNVIGEIKDYDDLILEIGKNANFRSDRLLVNALSRMRPELPQNEVDPGSMGELDVYLTNSWKGVRRTENHWQGDLPEDIAHQSLTNIKEELKHWDFSPEKTKILMLTNNVLANEQGYVRIAKLFARDTDDYLKKNNHYIKFLIDTVEEVAKYFEDRKYGEMFKVIGTRTPKLRNQHEKRAWDSDLKRLLEVRKNGTIGDIIDLLKETGHPRLSSKVEQQEAKYMDLKELSKEELGDNEKFFDRIEKIRSIEYTEIIELSKYLDDKTPFSTKHGVKGAEFENVLVVCGRGWNHYNWDNFLSWYNNGIPKDKESAFERNRNLFYVCCSRPKKRLAVLFTQQLSGDSISTLNNWFLEENIKELKI